MKFRILSPVLLYVALSFWGCKKQEKIEPELVEGVNFKEMKVPNGFDYATTALQDLNVHVELLGGEPYKGAEFDVCLDNPSAYLDQQESPEKLRRIMSIRLDEKGNYATELRIPQHIEKVYLLSKSIGIPEYFELSKSTTGFSVNYNPNSSKSPKTSGTAKFSNSGVMTNELFSAGFTTAAVRSWNNVGFPDYLTNPVYVNPSFLQRFKSALPKGVPVPVGSNYLNSSVPRNIVLDLKPGQTANVSITFMFANSANKNTLGYYWHPTNSKPASASAIPAANKGYIFPSTSRTNTTDYSGLVAGNTVELIGPNADGSFPPNTTIGFFLIANSFTPTAVGTPGLINTTRTTYYSDYNLNTAGSTGYMAGKKERMVTLYDEATNKIVWSIEDGTDGDYSDIAFFASWNPNEAINVDNFPKLPTVPRTDSDYIFYPAKNVKGTLLFEDCWPRLADFDMNDMVVNHNYVGLLDQSAANKVSEVNFTFDLASISAQQNNSFAVMVPNIAPSQVAIVTNVNFDGANINSNRNVSYAVESGHTNDVVIRVFDGATTILGGNNVNNIGEGSTTRAVETFSFTIKFNPSISVSDFNKISPFMIPRGNRNVEIHLSNRRPSIKANKALFGTDDDNSSVAAGRYYLSNTKNSAGNINWAIDVPEKIPYPKSGASMTLAYPNFVSWATSGATSHLDWYTNGTGNRVTDKLVNPPN
jgi:LruC domain-containing protein